MISPLTIIAILVLHWFCDFVMQTDEQALNKSSDNWALFDHVWDYTMSLSIGILAYLLVFQSGFTLSHGLYFIFITFAAHFATDYVTSRMNAKLWKAERRHDFFVMVGFDQLLHYFQLFVTYYFLFV